MANEPAPVPEAADVSAIKFASLCAVHVQPLAALTVMVEFPPSTGNSAGVDVE
jgi:hypothetical protein